MAISEEFSEWFEGNIVDNVWLISLIVIILAGLFLVWKSWPNLKLPESIHIMRNRKSDAKGITTMGSFFVALSCRIGAGNIIGISLAIIVGGPGAILWLWVFSLFGAVLCFAECTLGQIFKEKRCDGLFRGGPAYYALKGLHSRRIAIIFSVLMIIVGLILGGVQACNMNNAIRASLEIDTFVLSILISIGVAVFLCIGLRRMTKFLTYFVPVFTIAWMVVVIATMIINIDKIPGAIGSIFSYGLGFESLAGAGMGLLMITGFKRGAFCSEGGTGQVSSISSSADDNHPCTQGYMQAMGVYVDIFFVCTMTAFLVLIYGLDKIPFGLDNADEAVNLVVNALGSGFLGDLSKPFFTIVMFSITFSCIFADYLTAEANLKYIFNDDRRAIIVMNVLFVVVVFVMSLTKISFVWALGDLFIGLLVLLNVYMIFRLYKYVDLTTKDYREQRRKGVEKPTFDSEKALVGLETAEITEWKSS